MVAISTTDESSSPVMPSIIFIKFIQSHEVASVQRAPHIDNLCSVQ